ncbi:MAG: hypothetical protein ACXAEU_19210 [Candidatus Hodarchaeales archaeon]|jgi:hypothetical protein
MTGTENVKNKLLQFLRLDSSSKIKMTAIGSIIGILAFILLDLIVLPEYFLMGLLKVTVDMAIVVIPIVAAFCGPLAGFITGFFGSLGADLLYNQQVVALGSINFALGMLGFIIGIPKYTEDNGFADGRKLVKLILFTIAGFLIAVIIYLISLLVIANQSFLGTLLYNFLPFFSVSFISLVLIAPVAVRITEIVVNLVMEQIASRNTAS